MTSTVPAAGRTDSTAAVPHVWKSLQNDGYAVVTDRDLGLPPELRQHIHRTYFNNRYLRRYPNDIPADRERARDVVQYTWNGDALTLAEHDTVAIEGRGDQPVRREFERAEVLADPHFHRWISTALSLIPPDCRQARGTFGVNLFRTHTCVVTRPHQDEEQYVLTYVLERVGSGAESLLYRLDAGENPRPEEVVHHGTLEPGDLIIFRDSDFRHSATPLIDPPHGTAHRDALVCTVNYPGTYPLH
jgi:hypothetical protein